MPHICGDTEIIIRGIVKEEYLMIISGYFFSSPE